MKRSSGTLLVLALSVLGAIGMFIVRPPGPLGTSATPTTTGQITVAACNAASDGAVVNFPPERFSSWFPCPPTQTLRKANAVPFGEIEISTYEVEVQGVIYSASYVNYADKLPAAAFDLAKSVVLDGAKRSLVRGQPVKDPVYKDVQMGSISGIEVSASGDDKKLRGRVWLVNQVTYQIVVLSPKNFANEDQITRFLDSFALVPATPAK